MNVDILIVSLNFVYGIYQMELPEHALESLTLFMEEEELGHWIMVTSVIAYFLWKGFKKWRRTPSRKPPEQEITELQAAVKELENRLKGLPVLPPK